MVIYQSKSLKGIRDENEDEIDTIVNENRENPELNSINYFAVYDGHGGKHVSAYVKLNLHRYFMNKSNRHIVKKGKTYNKFIKSTFNHLQGKISKEIDSTNCGSTALIVIQHSNGRESSLLKYLKVINLGDCRVVLCNQYDIAIPLSKDHKPMSWNENKRILDLGGTITHAVNDDPRIGSYSVSRAFGDLSAKPYLSHIPDVYDYELECDETKIIDKFMILACDGVWDVLSCQDAVDFVLYRMSELPRIVTCDLKGVNNISQMLGKYAIEKGSTDNISVVIVFF